MIHDLDLLTMLTGQEPSEIRANAVSVMGEAEDMCNTPPTLEFGLDCTANVTASRLGLKTERKLRIISEDSYVSADFVKKSVTMVRKIANEEQLLDLRTRLAAGEDLSSIDYVDLVEVEEPTVGDEDALSLASKRLFALRSYWRKTIRRRRSRFDGNSHRRAHHGTSDRCWRTDAVGSGTQVYSDPKIRYDYYHPELGGGGASSIGG